MPRDPDLDTGVLDRYLNAAAEGLGGDGLTWGVRIILEDRQGGRYVGTFDPPEAALEYARDLMAQAWRAIEQRDGAERWITPRPPLVRTYLMTASTEERRKALDPKTCDDCGRVQGPTFDRRHHRSDCTVLLDHLTNPETS